MSLTLDKKLFTYSKKELPSSIARLAWSKEKLEKYQLQKIKSILNYAKTYSSWYKKSLSNIDIANFTLKDMQSIPILTKKIFMENWDNIITDPRLKLTHVLNLIEKKEKTELPYRITRSGGTSGHTGVYVFDRTAWVSSFNSIIRFFRHENTVRTFKRSRLCRVTLAAPFSNHMTSALMAYPKEHINDIYLPVTMPYASILKKLNKISPDVLQGYPSVLSQIANSQLQGDIKMKPGFIISMAEPIDNSVYKLIKKAWNVKIYDIWATGEFGPLGVSCHICSNMILNSDHCFFEYEFLNSYLSSKHGVLITGLQNKVMPLIRYKIEDQLKASKIDTCCSNGFGVISGVVGRPGEVFIYGNIQIHGYCFRLIFLSFPSLTDYQLVQTKQGMAVHIKQHIRLSNTMETKLKKLISESLQKHGLNLPKIEIKYVTSLKKTPGGKVPRLLPLRM